MRNYNKQILFFSLVVILLCFLGVFIFTLPAFINRLNLSLKDNIGDAVGGLTAPIIGIITSILLYITLSRQVESNVDQKLKNESDILFLLLNQLDNEVSRFYYKYSRGDKEFKFEGLHGMNEFAKDFVNYSFKSFNFTFKALFEAKQFLLIIRSYELIEKRIQVSSLSDNLKPLFQAKLETFYDCVLKFPLETINITIEKNEKMKDNVTEEIYSFICDKK